MKRKIYKKKRFILPLIFSTLFVFLIFTISYIEQELKFLIDDELKELAKKSCNCEFVKSEINVSLLGLKAEVKKPRLVRDNEVGLSFERAVTSISLSKVFDNEIHLTKLRLESGEAKNFDAKSVLFKLIDEITTPNPNKKSPWKVRVRDITVTDSILTQKLESINLRLSKTSATLKNNWNGTFELRPFVGKLDLNSNSTKKLIVPMHSLSSVATIFHDRIELNKINWRTGFTRSQSGKLTYYKKSEELIGELGFLLDPRDVGIPGFIKGKVVGTAKVSGNWSEPEVVGEIFSDEANSYSLILGEKTLNKFEDLKADFKLDWIKESPRFSLFNLTNKSEINLKLNKSIVVTPSILSVDLDLDSKSLAYDYFDFKDTALRLNIAGSVDDANVELIGKTSNIDLFGYYTGESNLSFVSNKGVKKLKIAKTSDKESFLTIAFDDAVVNSEKIFFDFSKFSLTQKIDGVDNKIYVRGSGSFSDYLNKKESKGKAKLAINSGEFIESNSFIADVDYSQGLIKSKIVNSSKSLSANLKLPLLTNKQASLSLLFKDFSFEEYFPTIKCSSLNGNLNYEFLSNKALAGNGDITLESANFGCSPYNLGLNKKALIKIKKGKADLNNLNFIGKFGSLKTKGDISLRKGFNLKATSKLRLETLLSISPVFDDLRGNANANLSIIGPLSKPKFSGEINLKDASFYIESIKLNSSEINGKILLKKSVLDFDNVEGKLNDGKINVNGKYDIFANDLSTIDIALKEIHLEPYENSHIDLSGKLFLITNTIGETELKGDLQVKRAIWEQYLNISSIIDSISEIFLYDDSQKLTVTQLPEILLNVNVSAERDVLFLTNFMEVELAANLRIGGSLIRPKVYGNLNSLAGWLGYKDKRFDITSGLLSFNPGDLIPQVDLISETILDTQTGESILTILQAKGSIIDPKLTLTTDNNLREDEILTLLAISQRDNFATQANTISKIGNAGGISLFNDKSSLFENFLHNLTKFDSFSIEPTANLRSGLIVPTFIAKKYLNEKLSLRGESNLSTDTPGSRVFMDYNIDTHLRLRGGVDTETVQDETSLIADLSYTLFAKKKSFLEIEIHGNKTFSRSKLLELSRLTENSRVDYKGSKNLEETFSEIYREAGYFDAKVKTACRLDENALRKSYCRKLTVNINTGERYKLVQVSVVGDQFPEIINPKNFIEIPRKQFATKLYFENYRTKLINNLRNEGYIKARISLGYKLDYENKTADIIVDLKSGDPVSFVFKGNTIFSPKDFLNTINLFERNEPFGNNTINILVQRIEKLYRDIGFLFATINFKLYKFPNTNRQQYEIEIKEGISIGVGEVVFEGIDDEEQRNLKAKIKSDYRGRYKQIFNPKYALAEEIVANTILIKQLYQYDGYPYFTIEYKLDIAESLDKINIVYNLKKGKAYNADWLRIVNFPKNIELPKKPRAPYSLLKANEYLEKLIVLLEDNGYYQSSFYSEIDVGNHVTINFNPGVRAKIKDIIITGNANISKELITSKLVIKGGDFYRKEFINKSKKNLLSLGLFSRVSIEPIDGLVDSESERVVIEVLEQPLKAVQFGGGLHSELGFHLFSEVMNKSLFLDGRSLAFRSDIYYDAQDNNISQGIISLALKQPKIYDSMFDANYSIRYQKQDLTTFEFDLDRFVFDTSFFTQLNNNLRFNFGISLLQENLDNVPNDVVLTEQDTGTATFGLITFGLFYDKRDNPINPERGFQVFIESDIANSLLFSEADYISLSSGLSNIFTVAPRFQLANRFSLSSGWTTDSQTTLPISQRFYAGGRVSVRGFRENSLGPRGVDGNVIGGDFMLVNNLELRYRVTETIQLHTFFDSGNVFLRDTSVDLDDLRHSVGLGFRYISPIGPVGFDLGRPIDEQVGEPSVRLHFSVGSRF